MHTWTEATQGAEVHILYRIRLRAYLKLPLAHVHMALALTTRFRNAYLLIFISFDLEKVEWREC